MADINTLLGLRRRALSPISAASPEPELTDEQLNQQVDEERRRTIAATSPFQAGLRQGLEGLAASGHGVAGLARGAFGDTEGARQSLRRMQADQAIAAQYTDPEAATVEDAWKNGHLGRYALHQLGAFTPDIAAVVAPALITGGASALVTGGLRRAAAGAAARAAGREAIEREAAKLTARGAPIVGSPEYHAAWNVANKIGRPFAEGTPLRVAPRMVADSYAGSAPGREAAARYLAEHPTSAPSQIGPHAGAVLGGAFVSGEQAASGIDPNLSDEQLQAASRKGLAGAVGLGAIQALPGVALMRRFGVGEVAEKAIAKRLGKPLLQRLAREGGEQAALGAGAGTATVAASRALHNWITGDGQSIVGPDAMSDYLNAIAGGAIGGFVFGAPAGFRGGTAAAPAARGAAARMWRFSQQFAKDKAESNARRYQPGEEMPVDAGPAHSIFDKNLEGVQNDLDSFTDDLLKNVRAYDVRRADTGALHAPDDSADTGASLSIGTSAASTPGASLFDGPAVKEVATNARTLGLDPKSPLQHAMAALITPATWLKAADAPRAVKAVAKAMARGYDALGPKDKAAVHDYVDLLPPELASSSGPVMRLLATTNELAKSGDLHRLDLAPKKGADVVEPGQVERTARSDTGLEGRLTELDAAPSSDLGYVPDDVWNGARFFGAAKDRGSPDAENVRLNETAKDGTPRSVDLNIKRAAGALSASREGKALLSKATNRKTTALLGIATEAADRGTPIDPATIRPGLRVFPDKDGEKGTLTPAEARALRTQLEAQGTGKAVPKGVARPQRDAATQEAAARQQAAKTAREAPEGFAGAGRDRRALGEGDFDEATAEKLGPRKHPGAATGDTATPPRTGQTEALALRKTFLADLAKLQKKGGAAKTPEAKRAVFLATKERRAQYAADRDAAVKHVAPSGGERGTKPNDVDLKAHKSADMARVDQAAKVLGISASTKEEGAALRTGVTAHGSDSAARLSGLYRAGKAKPTSPARTALLGAVRRLADGDERLTEALDTIDRRSTPAETAGEAKARGRTVQNDTDLPGPPLSRGDTEPGTVLDSIARAKKDPTYAALFKAVGDLSKGKAGKGTEAKTQALVDDLGKAFGVPRADVKFFDPGTPGFETALGRRSTEKGRTTIYVRRDLKAHERTSVLMHEYGHHLQQHLFDRLPDDHPTKVAVRTAYDDWLAQHQVGDTYNTIRASRAPFFRSLYMLRKGVGDERSLGTMSAKDRDYILSFDEFFADMTARALEQHEGVQGIVGQFFAKVAHALHLVYDLMRGHDLRLTDTPTAFRDFVHKSFMAGADEAPEHVWEAAAGGDGAGTPAHGVPGGEGAGPHGGAGSTPSDVSSLLPPRDRGLVAKLLTRRDVFEAILKERPELTDALLTYDTQMETAINAGFALWAEGKLPLRTVDKSLVGAMERFGEGVLGSFGMTSKQAMAERLFNKAAKGALVKGYDSRTELRAAKTFALTRAYAKALKEGNSTEVVVRRATLGVRRAVLAASKLSEQRLKPIGERLLNGMDERLRATNVPALRRLAAMVHLQTGEQGAEAMTARIQRSRAGYYDRYATIIDGLDKKTERALVRALRRKETLPAGPLEVKRKQLRTLLDDMHGYQEKAGATVGKVGDFWPVHVDTQEVQAKADDFRAMLADPRLADGMNGQLQKLFESQGMAKTAAYKKIKAMSQDDKVDIFFRMAASEGELSVGGTSYAEGSFAAPGGSEFRPRVSEFIYESGAKDIIDKFANFQTDSLDAVMMPYIGRAVRRAEFSRTFFKDRAFATPQERAAAAMNGELRTNVLNELLDQAKEQGASDTDVKLARDYVDASLGVLGTGRHPVMSRVLGAVDNVVGSHLADVNSKTWRSVSNAIIAYQNLRILGLGLFGNMIDPLGVWVRSSSAGDAWSGYRQAARAIFTKGGARFLRDQAEVLGITERHALSEALAYAYGGDQDFGSLSNRINRAVFKYNGMELITKFARTAALATGHRFLLRHAEGANAHSARYLRELGLTAADVKPDPAHPGFVLRNEKIDKALYRFVDESVLRPVATQRPGWQNDPHFAIAAQYKGYLYSFYNTIVKRMVHEAQHGNVGGVAPIVGYIGVTMAAELAREMVQYGAAGNPHRKDWDAGDYMAFTMQRTGMFGPRVEFYQSAGKELGAYGTAVPVPYESLAGPSVQQLDDLGAMAFGRRSVGHTVAESLPLQSVYRGWSADPATPNPERGPKT